MGNIAEKAREWLWNTVQVVITLFLIGFVLLYIADTEGFRTRVNGFFVSCDRLMREIVNDDMCRRSEDCQLTRDELVESRERVEKYDRYCRKQN